MILCSRWPMAPLTGPWHELSFDSAAELRALLAGESDFVDGAGPTENMKEFRVRPLPFWPDWMWVDALVEADGQPAAAASFLYGPHGPLLLDGTSRIIHDLNDLKLLRIDQEAAACHYLRFFCSAVRGDEGPFYLIESAARFQEIILAFDIPQAVIDFAKPLTARRTHDGWRMTALVLYGSALFKAVFAVSLNGMVEMTDDEPLAEDLPDTLILFDGHLSRQRRIGLT